jgi:hypothetical protein
MLCRPEGLFPSRRRKRERHAADDLGDGTAELSGSLGEAPQ